MAEAEFQDDVTSPTDPTTNPSTLPSVTPKPGWQTSEGQITGVVSFAFTALALVGYHFSPETTNNVYDMIHQLFVTLVPIIGVVGTVIAYINSRGKVKSNSINATASMSIAPLVGGLGGLLGGESWKDPERYVDLAKIAAGSGLIPGSSVVNKVLNTDSDFEQHATEAIKTLDHRVTLLEAK